MALTTVHRTIIAADVEGFGQPNRNNINQVRIRDGMYTAMEHAFDISGIPWSSCHHGDRGDGMLILAPADISKTLFVDHLPDALEAALCRYNRMHPAAEQIRLRLALHAGEINYDQYGVTATSINHTFRLLDADAFRSTLAESKAVLAIIGSAWFFDEVIRHSELSCAKSYKLTDIVNKETSTTAWIRLLKSHRTVRCQRTHPPYDN